MKKTITSVILAGIISVSVLTACTTLDVVGKDSIRAFGEVLSVLPALEKADGGWRITAPDSNAWFDIDNVSVVMGVSAQPFINAGLDISKLDNFNGEDIVFISAGFDMENQNIKSDALSQFAADSKALSKDIGYHTALDHYNINLGDGNLFEWAKDLSVNSSTKENQDKDIVFVLNPEPLIAAGVDPAKVEGWAFAKVTVDIDSKPTEVDKFLKPFNLK